MLAILHRVKSSTTETQGNITFITDEDQILIVLATLEPPSKNNQKTNILHPSRNIHRCTTQITKVRGLFHSSKRTK